MKKLKQVKVRIARKVKRVISFMDKARKGLISMNPDSRLPIVL